MRTTMIALLAIGAGLSTPAFAQAGRAAPAVAPAKNSPEAIVCAMTGSCGGTDQAADGRLDVGNEKAFSLARSSAATPAPHAAPSRSYAPARSFTAPSRSHMAAGLGRAPVRPARLSADGGLDMQVTFALGSAELTPQARSEARAFATAMAAPAMAGRSFAIEGHTDSSGNRQRNVDLSQRRAQSVVDFLVGQGVDASRLSAKGYGPDKPLPGTSASASANRRVEFVRN
jgi:outer membrane protein OmpA-like peptidoglycan-associated protein